ncbi:hypothetical protein MMC20_005275 [Loxospora ochrophaea]|nr:hypothetical protein [Loxospora ochrophaea]
MPGQGPPQGPPGAFGPETPGPADALPVSRMNELYMQQKQGMNDRLEADSRGHFVLYSTTVLRMFEILDLFNLLSHKSGELGTRYKGGFANSEDQKFSST